MLAALLAAALAQAKPKAPPEIVANLQWVLGRPADTEWQPLHLDLQSAAARDLDVEIAVHDPASRSRLVRRETVPAGGRRKLFLHLPTGRMGYGTSSIRPELSVRTPEGRELASFLLGSPRAWSDEDTLVGLLTSAPSTDAGLGQGWRLGGANVEVVRLTPDFVPDRWTGLAPLRALILHDAPLDALGPEQARALRDYVRQGGLLILSPGSARTPWAHPAVAAIAEIRAGEARTRDEFAALHRKYPAFLAGAPSFRFHPILGGKTLPDLEDLGIRRFDAGFGRVLALPFDIRRAPFDGWPGLPILLNDLIATTPRADAGWAVGGGLPGELSAGGSRSRVLGRMLSLVNPYPSFLLLAGLTVLYLLLVGPLNYALLRRLRMTLLLVVTVPAVSVAFLSLTLGVAYLVKGSTTTVTSVRLLTAVDGVPCARDIGVTAVFSPSTREYVVTPPADRAALPFDRTTAAERRGNPPGPLDVQELPAGPRFRSVAIGQWQSWALETRAIADLGTGVRWTARGGVLRVENGSALDIERAVFIRAGHGGFASPLGALAPGRALEAPLQEARWAPLGDLGFAPESLGGRVLAASLESLRQQYRRDEPEAASRRRQEEWLVCVVREAGPGVEVDARRAGDSRSLTLLFVRGEAP